MSHLVGHQQNEPWSSHRTGVDSLRTTKMWRSSPEYKGLGTDEPATAAWQALRAPAGPALRAPAQGLASPGTTPRPGLRSPATFPGSFPEGGARWSGARVPRRGRPARAEKAGPQPRAARPSPDRGNNCSLGPRLRRCAPRRPGAPRLDGAPSQTFLAPFLVAGQSPVQRWRREVSGPGEHEGERYEESASAAGTQSALRGPETCSGAQRFCWCAERRLCSLLCCWGAGCLLFVATLGDVSTPRC